jgi:hypothetical protein
VFLNPQDLAGSPRLLEENCRGGSETQVNCAFDRHRRLRGRAAHEKTAAALRSAAASIRLSDHQKVTRTLGACG